MRGIHIFRALYFIPAISGSIAIGLAWKWLFDRNGLINSLLQSWGVITVPIQWLATPSLVLPIAMLLTIWAGVGFYSVIFLAGLQNIPEELYDAALIDGATNFQKHRYVSLPGLRPQIVFVAIISSLAALKVFDEIYVLTNRTGGILDSGVTMVFYLWKEAFQLDHAGYASAIAIAPARDHPGLLDLQRADPRARSGRCGMSHAAMANVAEPVATHPADPAPTAPRPGRVERPLVHRPDPAGGHHGLPVLLDADDLAQGPGRPGLLDPAAVHPERPEPGRLPDACSTRCRSRRFFLNSLIVAVSVGLLNVLVAAMAAYPLAKMRFLGRDAIFYALLATLIVPAQLTYIPSFVLAVNVFHYYDTLPALIFPNLVSAFNIFLLRQAFRGVPNDLIEAARIDGAGEWRIWWSILLPIVRPSLAAVAIFTFVTSWNDFLWPSLMLHTKDGLTLPVGLAALQSFFQSDFRSIAAGVIITVVPILLFFIVVQRYFVRGLAGAVKG